MKAFETPYVDVKKFDVQDILTTSGGTTGGYDPATCPENTETPCFDD